MLASMMLLVVAGCNLLEVSHKPVVYNPFPQLSRVAVTPFFNQSDEPTVDGRKFALAYFAELQAIPGFEVVPLGVVEEAILEHRVNLSSVDEVRRLARILNVDAVVIGSVTDYTPYYPPRCGLRVEWYAANPGFHEIPPGYGLPWGTPEEEFIPPSLVFEAEMARAKAELASQTPVCEPPVNEQRATSLPVPGPATNPARPSQRINNSSHEEPAGEDVQDGSANTIRSAFFDGELREEELPLMRDGTTRPLPAMQSAPTDPTDTTGATGAMVMDCPRSGGHVGDAAGPERKVCVPNPGPVMTHTRIYHGHDSDFAAALANYYYFRADARFGGWQNYLQRSDDFIRFCCHMHIAEMLSARGGGDQTRVVWRCKDCR